jgi:hypothetical protein
MYVRLPVEYDAQPEPACTAPSLHELLLANNRGSIRERLRALAAAKEAMDCAPLS